jgi:1-acyl-sn-glycerol-3-phosphate acyltransferase
MVTLPLMGLQGIMLRVSRPLSLRVPLLFHRAVCRIIGIRIHVIGKPVKDRPVLLACNHTSWLDISILSTLRPCSFIAKREISDWPFFGTLARLQRSVFVERSRRTETRYAYEEIVKRLSEGDALVLFPEGTSGDGNGVYPFKSALMGAADLQIPNADGKLEHVAVQPVSVAYAGQYGLPMGRVKRPLAAWYGRMQLVPHLWQVLANGNFDVVIECHAPVTIADFGDRKALSVYCEETVAAGLVRALTGRPGDRPIKPRRAVPTRHIPGPRPGSTPVSDAQKPA